MKTIVVAYDKNRAIGANGELPWRGQLPADMHHFAEITAGQTVIMGRRTYDSLSDSYRPLPNRQNVVLSLSGKAIDGLTVARSLDEAYELAEHEPMVIGGGQIYVLALPTVDRVLATAIDAVSPNADVYFPELNPNDWRRADIAMHDASPANKYNYSFVTYLRRHPIDESAR